MKTNRFKPQKQLGEFEFIFLMAMICALGALATDAMLPSLTMISKDFQLTNPNQVQLIIGIFFLGLGLGSPFFGPLADSIGRKKSISIGLILFLIGCLVSLISEDMNTLLFSRFIQGIGASSTRIIANAMIRDRFSGRQMARVNSLVASIFIMIPVVAPFFGQTILNFFHWRMIFVSFILICIALMAWFYLRQKETLKAKNKIPFHLGRIKDATIECIREKQTLGYALSGGFIFSILLIFLLVCPQIFKEIYLVGDDFPKYFAFVAASMGISSILNSFLVIHFGMIYLSNLFLKILIISSILFFIYLHFFVAIPNIIIFVAYMMIIFFSLGMVFGNFLALSLQRVGHIAGVASSLVTSISLLISFLISLIAGQLYSQSIELIVIAFFGIALAARILVFIFADHPQR